MARASRSPTRYSLPMQPHTQYMQPQQLQQQQQIQMHTEYLIDQLQKKYSEQNKELAQTTIKLQLQNSELEQELAQANRELVLVKRKNHELISIIKGKLVTLNNEFDTKMNDLLETLGSDPKTIISRRVTLNAVEEKTHAVHQANNADYLKHINNELRRKSIGRFSLPELPAISEPAAAVENNVNEPDLSLVEENEEPEPEPAYEDVESKVIPSKRRRESGLFSMQNSNSQLSQPARPTHPNVIDHIPNLSMNASASAKNTNPNDINAQEESQELIVADSDANEANVTIQDSDPFNDSENAKIPTTAPTDVNQSMNESDVSFASSSCDSPVKKKQRIPKMLRELDAEKTKKWTRVDINESRSSRRSSLIPRFDMSIDNNNNKSSARSTRISVYKDSATPQPIPEEREEDVAEVRKPLGQKSNNTLNKKKVKTTKKKNVSSSGDMSIFDLSNENFLNIPIQPLAGTKPKKAAGRRRRKYIDEFIL